jgi:hypothetical protein
MKLTVSIRSVGFAAAILSTLTLFTSCRAEGKQNPAQEAETKSAESPSAVVKEEAKPKAEEKPKPEFVTTTRGPSATDNWPRLTIKGYSIPYPKAMRAWDEEELAAYNRFLRLVVPAMTVDYDARVTNPGAGEDTPLHIHFNVLPRGMSDEELQQMQSDPDATAQDTVSWVDNQLAGLSNMRGAGSHYDAKAKLLVQTSTSTDALGRNLYYCGAILIRGGTQIEIHGNCRLGDAKEMSSTVLAMAAATRASARSPEDGSVETPGGLNFEVLKPGMENSAHPNENDVLLIRAGESESSLSKAKLVRINKVPPAQIEALRMMTYGSTARIDTGSEKMVVQLISRVLQEGEQVNR